MLDLETLQNAPSAQQIETFIGHIQTNLLYQQGIRPENATLHDVSHALALAVRNYLIDRMFATEDRYQKAGSKRVCYLSMEFLIGRLLGANLYNLGMSELADQALQKGFGMNLAMVEEAEADAALGNGGLGRLAACFLDSLATLDMPGYGYGINYEYGLFKQRIDEDGRQKEVPDHWLHEDAPWLMERPDDVCVVPLYGDLLHSQGSNGQPQIQWNYQQVIIGVPFDVPIAGHGGKTVNILRLYSARSSNEFDIKIFNGGDYIKAVEKKIESETVSKVLYPSDSCWGGKALRLIQEYFLVACALNDILNRYIRTYSTDLRGLPDKYIMQLNDTHPSLTVAELMRVLMDVHGFNWEDAWAITEKSCAYTNHTLLPEALEKWPVTLLEDVLPRHLNIIYEINHRFLQYVESRWPGDGDALRRLSLVEEGWDKQIRMAHLAIVGSKSVNGVAALHSELVKSRLVPDFYALWPSKFNNKTNGVTPRRWLAQANPQLAALISGRIGKGWVSNLDLLRNLEPYCDDEAFQEEFNLIKKSNKERLSKLIFQSLQIRISENSLFDVQIKRIHEYKRQLLNIMHVIRQYVGIVDEGEELPVPKTYIFAGKAAPGYMMAKLIIRLINSVAKVVNNDPRVGDQIKVVFMPDYRVSLAEKIIPAAELSEQISTAGTEASGTGNMKLAMNGALTIGTLDGANIEIREEVGEDNIFIFGLRAEEIERMRHLNTYHPWDYFHRSSCVRKIIDALNQNRFSPHEPGLFQPIIDTLLDNGDYFFHLADLESYSLTQLHAASQYNNRKLWTRKAILNVARMGKFSSDRTVREYAQDIWEIQAISS